MPLQFLCTLTAVMARPSFEGHGLSDEPKLISQSVHLHEVPTKIIKVTKTVAIKVPVPYPVKVSRCFVENESSPISNRKDRLLRVHASQVYTH